MKWMTFQAFNLPAGKERDVAYMTTVQGAYEHFKRFRAEVIEAGLFVESTLNNVLLDFLAPPSLDGRDRLRSLVLDAEFCSFFQKWRLLKQLLKLYESGLHLDQGEMKTLRKNLHEVIALRNQFAHGQIYVNGTDFSVWLEYVDDTKKRVQLNEEQLRMAKEQCDLVHKLLWKVHETIEKVEYALPPPKA